MTRRTSLIQIRVTEDEKAAITKRAGSLSVGEYMRGLALGAVPESGPVPEAVSDRAASAGSLAASASPRASARTKEPVAETPLPKIAKRHWAQ